MACDFGVERGPARCFLSLLPPMFFRLPILLARRVAVPAAAPRLLLARPFSYTPLALSPAQAKTRGRPKTASKTKASITKTKAKAKPRPKVRATTSGRKEVVKKVQQRKFLFFFFFLLSAPRH